MSNADDFDLVVPLPQVLTWQARRRRPDARSFR
jgi:hypothetical protein